MVGSSWLQLESRQREQRNLELAEQTAKRETLNSERGRLADKREQLADERHYTFHVHSGGNNHPDSAITVELSREIYAQCHFGWNALFGEYLHKEA